VIVLHGGGGNARNAEAMTGFTRKAEREGFIVAYPEGTAAGRLGLFTWNAGHCCGYAMEQRVDDVGFIGALIDRLQATHRIDPRRVYVTGMSNGAMMSHRLGIELSHRIAAIAPVVGAVFGDEVRPRAPVSAIMINGMLDKSVPYGGGASGGVGARAWDGTPGRPAVDQAAFWASANGCNAAPQTRDQGRYLIAQYDCPSPLGVAMYSVKDNGHAWPGGRKGTRRADTPSTAIDATDVIWEFFAAHPKR
jgi:polyhydroxybutyrate depolymerase